MYKVLLVDDEPSIREGLRTLVDWNGLGFDVIGDAANGRDGLRKGERLRPDLVLADIRMPGMDGLQMIEELRGLGHSCSFIILSGYSDFQYAKRAIDNRVDSYLLKPIDPEELRARLVRIHEAMASEQANRERLADSRLLHREQWLQSLMTGADERAGGPAVLSLPDGMAWPWKSSRVLLAEVEPPSDAAPAARRLLKSHLQGAVEKRGLGLVCALDEFVAVLLKEPSPRVVRTLLAEAARAVKLGFGLDTVACVGIPAADAARIPGSYESALALSRNKFLYRSDGDLLIGYGEAGDAASGVWRNTDTAPGAETAPFDLPDAAVKLAYSVEAGNAGLTRDILGATAAELAASRSSDAEIKTRFALLYTEVVHALMRTNEELRQELSRYLAHRQDLGGYRSLGSLLAGLRDRFAAMSDTIRRSRPDGAFRSILEFIERHYDEDLKLEKLAEIFHYNSSYLGKLFKQQTGESFRTHLDRIRIERAKELLKQNFKVHQVASRVGFSNPEYFYSKFRKYVGLTPSTYRDRPD